MSCNWYQKIHPWKQLLEIWRISNWLKFKKILFFRWVYPWLPHGSIMENGVISHSQPIEAYNIKFPYVHRKSTGQCFLKTADNSKKYPFFKMSSVSKWVTPFKKELLKKGWFWYPRWKFLGILMLLTGLIKGRGKHQRSKWEGGKGHGGEVSSLFMRHGKLMQVLHCRQEDQLTRIPISPKNPLKGWWLPRVSRGEWNPSSQFHPHMLWSASAPNHEIYYQLTTLTLESSPLISIYSIQNLQYFAHPPPPPTQ